LQEDSTSVACADRERVHQLGVSNKGGAPFIEEGFELRRRDFGNSRYWVSFAGVLESFLVVFWSLSVED
jgi:hypothetical protein